MNYFTYTVHCIHIVLTSACQVVKLNILLLRQETILAQQMLKYQAITFSELLL